MHCTNCGNKLEDEDKFCPNCGTLQNKNIVENQEIRSTRRKYSFNIWAAIFGPLYYIYKGLWKKGLLLNSLLVIAMSVSKFFLPIEIISVVSLILQFVVYGFLGSIDIFRQEQSGEVMWEELPSEFNRGVLVITVTGLAFIVFGFSYKVFNISIFLSKINKVIGRQQDSIMNFVGVILGAIIGGGTSLLSNYISDKRETKRHREKMKQNEHEIRREDSLRSLYELLLPIKDIYRRSDLLYEWLLENEYHFKGKGLCSDFKIDLEQVMKKDYRLLNIELWEKYHQTNNAYISELLVNPEISNISGQEYNGEKIKDYFFDNDRQFITLVNERAQKIEQEYIDNIV